MRHQTQIACTVCLLLAWTLLLVPTNAAESDATAVKAGVRESFRFDPDDAVVLVPVHVADRDCQFVVDTGTSVNIFDVLLWPHLGPPVGTAQALTPNGNNIGLEMFSPPVARVGSLALNHFFSFVGCHDLTSFREASGLDIRGFLGMDFLKDWIVTIDFDEGRLDFLNPGTTRDPEWGEYIPFMYGSRGSMYILPTVGEDFRAPFCVDTGNLGEGGLEETLFSRLVGLHEVRVSGDVPCLTASGESLSRVGRLSQLSLASFQHQNLRLTSGNQNTVGLGYLRRYRVTIDFPNQRLYLKKGTEYANREPGPMCGITVRFKAGRIDVRSVDEKSPAHAADVRTNDAIVELCGKPVSEWKPSEIRRMLRVEGKTVEMTVERDGKRIPIEFTLKEYE
jgi:hypothetical protein